MEIIGTIRTVKEIRTRKKDIRKMQGCLVIMNEDGDRVDIKSDPSILEGVNPEEEVTVTISKANKTLKEALETKREEAADKKEKKGKK